MQEDNSTARESAHEDPTAKATRALVRRKQPNKPGELTPVQELAMQRIIGGGSIADAALAAHVDRRTVYRWLHADPNFAAAYATWQREVIASSRARVLAMTGLALDTVQNAMIQGDVRAAIQVAKAAGAMDAPNPGTTDPAYFRHRQKRRDRARKEAIEDALRDERLERPQNNPHRASHCEHMINGYVRERRNVLRNETPAQRTQRLKDQARRHRNFDPLTLRLLATMDDELAAAAAPASPRATTIAPSPVSAESRPASPAPATEPEPHTAPTNHATPSQTTAPQEPTAATATNDHDVTAPAAPPAEPPAFPGARVSVAKPADPAPAPPRGRPPKTMHVAYDGSDETDNEPGWVKIF